MSRQPYLHNLASLKLALDIQQLMKRSKPLINEAGHLMIIAQQDSIVPCVTIRRDPAEHAWVYGEASARKVTPFSDQAPADSVIRWLKTQAMGRLNVKVNLDQ